MRIQRQHKSLAERKRGQAILRECRRAGLRVPLRVRRLLESGQLTITDGAPQSVRELAIEVGAVPSSQLQRFAREAAGAPGGFTATGLARKHVPDRGGGHPAARTPGDVSSPVKRYSDDLRYGDKDRIGEDEDGDVQYGGDYGDFVGKEPGDADAQRAGVEHVIRDLELVARLFSGEEDGDGEIAGDLEDFAAHLRSLVDGDGRDEAEDETAGETRDDEGLLKNDDRMMDPTGRFDEDVPHVSAGQRLRASLRERLTEGQRNDVTQMILDELRIGFASTHTIW